tara:strand:+ start:574 stop:780 length:207 start_codon:yes stop_codon:yes gene_type:complete
MKATLKLHHGGTRKSEDIRERIRKCADTIIDNLDISEYVFEEFGHDLDVSDYERLNNMVYSELQRRIQ